MRIHSIQYADSSSLTQAQNHQRMDGLLSSIVQSDCIMMPELWDIGYHNFSAYADAASVGDTGVVVQMAQRHAQRLQCWVHSGSFVERAGEHLFNCSVLVNPQGTVSARYRKIHVFGYESQETSLITAGHEVVCVPTEHGHIALSCCYDMRFPELYRQLQEQGADIFCVCAAWPAQRLHAWRLFCQARAHENLAYVIACNAAGANGAGHSMVVNPLGEIICEADADECMMTADIDVELVARSRRTYPFIADRVLALPRTQS